MCGAAPKWHPALRFVQIQNLDSNYSSKHVISNPTTLNPLDLTIKNQINQTPAHYV